MKTTDIEQLIERKGYNNPEKCGCYCRRLATRARALLHERGHLGSIYLEPNRERCWRAEIQIDGIRHRMSSASHEECVAWLTSKTWN